MRRVGQSVAGRASGWSGLSGISINIDKISFPSQVVHGAFLIVNTVYLYRKSHIIVTDYPLRVSAHSLCARLRLIALQHALNFTNIHSMMVNRSATQLTCEIL